MKIKSIILLNIFALCIGIFSRGIYNTTYNKHTWKQLNITTNVIKYEDLISTDHICLPEPKEIKQLEKKTAEDYYWMDLIAFDDIDISEENQLGDMELVAQLVQAEAGNQDLTGKRLVADVVYNRVRNPIFPNTVEEVILQDRQFSVILNGAFDKAGWTIDEDSFKASEMEYTQRLDPGVLYFNNSKEVSGKDVFQYGDHWFGY